MGMITNADGTEILQNGTLKTHAGFHTACRPPRTGAPPVVSIC